MRPQPFTIEYSPAAVADLHRRIDLARWPDAAPGEAWGYGTDLAYLRELVHYWRSSFSWRTAVESLNHFDHYLTRVDGVEVHFLRSQGLGPDPLPLVLTHGWPGTFYEMLPVVARLADPVAAGGDRLDSFEVIVPSIPGFGYSPDPGEQRVDAAHTARLWDQLMADLGHSRYGAYGSDWGGLVTRQLSAQFPEHLIGIHTPGAPPVTREPETDEERAYLARRAYWGVEETGYQRIHGTKTQTLAYGLTDSPVGLAAWLVEKLRAWSDCHGDLESRFTKDQILTWVSIFWFTGSINSSMRYYHANGLGNSRGIQRAEESDRVPRGYTSFAGIPGMGNPPPSLADRTPNVTHWNHYDRGGHFPGTEEPGLLVDELRAFFRPLR